jgi:hypothetical protein
MDDQSKLNKILVRGLVFSIIWLAGFGSAIALYEGLKARRMIEANPLLRGKFRAWWCIIVGGCGVAALCAIVVMGIFNALGHS